MNEGPQDFVVAAAVGGPALLAWGLKSLRRERLMSDTPRSKASSAAMGLVEMSGTAHPTETLLSPLSSTPCCWWRCLVNEKSGDNTVRIKDVNAGSAFFLEDETGRVVVDPLGAEAHTNANEFALKDGSDTALLAALKTWDIDPIAAWTYRNITVTEHVIAAGQPLYVMGELCSLDQKTAAYVADRKNRFIERLRAAKRNPKAMAEADLNQDGVVDPEEWDAFRRKLETIFASDPLDASLRPRGILRASQGHPFILASSEAQVRDGLSSAGVAVVCGVLIEGAGAWLMSGSGWPSWLIVLVIGLGLVAGVAMGLAVSKESSK